jgi:ribosomal-protein-alanine N-acetyltransferase
MSAPFSLPLVCAAVVLALVQFRALRPRPAPPAAAITSPAKASRKGVVTLRAWSAASGLVQEMVDMFEDGSVAQMTLRIPHPYTAQDARWWLEQGASAPLADGSAGSWAIFENDLLVGGIGLEHVGAPCKEHCRTLGYYISPAARGRGVATRALGALLAKLAESPSQPVRRIEACIFAGNNRSGRVLEKCGFVNEGRAKAYYLKEGQHKDAVFYAKLL